MRVFFASMPSAVRKVIFTVGPLSYTVFTASHPPASAAITGISQTSGRRHRERGAATASGIGPGPLPSAEVIACPS